MCTQPKTLYNLITDTQTMQALNCVQNFECHMDKGDNMESHLKLKSDWCRKYNTHTESPQWTWLSPSLMATIKI